MAVKFQYITEKKVNKLINCNRYKIINLPYCRIFCQDCGISNKCVSEIKCLDNPEVCECTKELSWDESLKLDCPF